MKSDWRSLLRVAALVALVMVAIYVPQWLGLPVWVPFVAAALVGAGSVFFFPDTRRQPPDSNS